MDKLLPAETLTEIFTYLVPAPIDCMEARFLLELRLLSRNCNDAVLDALNVVYAPDASEKKTAKKKCSRANDAVFEAIDTTREAVWLYKYLLGKSNIDVRDLRNLAGMTPLHYSIYEKKWNHAKFALFAGVDVNAAVEIGPECVSAMKDWLKEAYRARDSSANSLNAEGNVEGDDNILSSLNSNLEETDVEEDDLKKDNFAVDSTVNKDEMDTLEDDNSENEEPESSIQPLNPDAPELICFDWIERPQLRHATALLEDVLGHRAIHLAATYRKASLVRLIIENGADPEAKIVEWDVDSFQKLFNCKEGKVIFERFFDDFDRSGSKFTALQLLLQEVELGQAGELGDVAEVYAGKFGDEISVIRALCGRVAKAKD